MASLPDDLRERLEAAPDDVGAIQDLVQEAFGPVDLDRSAVRLDPHGAPEPSCPACAGQRFGVPAELAEHGPAMCAAHAEMAATITEQRLTRAQVSNPEGWEAITHASSLLTEPTFGLPLALLRRLDEVADQRWLAQPPAPSRAEAELVLSLTEHLRGRPDDAADLLSSDRLPRDWLIELPMALSSAGLVDEAVAVGDALSELDQRSSAMYASDVAVILAWAGRAEQALQRVEMNLRRFPMDTWTNVHAGDVHLALSDRQRAEVAFGEALTIARAHGDAGDVLGAEQRLSELLADMPGREAERAAARRAELAERAAYSGLRLAVKVGRNDPCPCGSGRKYKRCCAA